MNTKKRKLNRRILFLYGAEDCGFSHTESDEVAEESKLSTRVFIFSK
jgi:hypothetical protein